MIRTYKIILIGHLSRTKPQPCSNCQCHCPMQHPNFSCLFAVLRSLRRLLTNTPFSQKISLWLDPSILSLDIILISGETESCIDRQVTYDFNTWIDGWTHRLIDRWKDGCIYSDWCITICSIYISHTSLHSVSTVYKVNSTVACINYFTKINKYM